MRGSAKRCLPARKTRLAAQPRIRHAVQAPSNRAALRCRRRRTQLAAPLLGPWSERAAQACADRAIRLLAGLHRCASACAAPGARHALWTCFLSPCGGRDASPGRFGRAVIQVNGACSAQNRAVGSGNTPAAGRKLPTRRLRSAASCAPPSSAGGTCLQPRRRNWQPLQAQQRASTVCTSAACRPAFGSAAEVGGRAPPAPTTTRSPKRTLDRSAAWEACARSAHVADHLPCGGAARL
jgi:hypothetical protein